MAFFPFKIQLLKHYFWRVGLGGGGGGGDLRMGEKVEV